MAHGLWLMARSVSENVNTLLGNGEDGGNGSTQRSGATEIGLLQEDSFVASCEIRFLRGLRFLRKMGSHDMRLGLIAGNGRFPFLVLDAARGAGHDVTVVAIKEEAFPDLEDAAGRPPRADLH